jgi:hypothetical protein
MAQTYDDKELTQHLENQRNDNTLEYGEKPNTHHVEDAVAADYIDPTVTISPEENKRLRMLAYKQCVVFDRS